MDLVRFAESKGGSVSGLTKSQSAVRVFDELSSFQALGWRLLFWRQRDRFRDFPKRPLLLTSLTHGQQVLRVRRAEGRSGQRAL